MKKYLLAALFFHCMYHSFAQQDHWTWTGGENNYKGVYYGVKGVADSVNRPGDRWGAATCTDTAGNLWFFGGAGGYNDLWRYQPATRLWTWMAGDSILYQVSVRGTIGMASAANKPGSWSFAGMWTDKANNIWLYSDGLWKYAISTGQWTWVHGITGTSPVYGQKGVAAAANNPGVINYPVEWADRSGNFWLYSKVVWKYDPVTDFWTWMGGDTAAVRARYGIKGVPDALNTPAYRAEASGWTDKSGNFWLFGGTGTVSTPYMFGMRQIYTGDLNDLWKYDPVGNNWIWMSGDSIPYSGGSATGPIGTSLPGNKPGARSGAVNWTDAAGNLWLYGGYTYTNFSIPNYNPLGSLWKYTITTNLWTLYGEATPFLAHDTFTIKGAESPVTYPVSRYNAAGWTDSSGYFWLFGGSTYNTRNLLAGALNDLLRYSPATNRWALMQEDNDARLLGVYGTKGVAGPFNTPGSRENAVTWTDSAGNQWLFGGRGFGPTFPTGILRVTVPVTLNDLWKRDKENQWTWISGINELLPRTRQNAFSWTDAGNKLWMFGGTESTDGVNVPGSTNDLWNYDISTNKWTTAGNSSTTARYGIKGQPAASNKPGIRENGISWTDKSGKLWMFGGGVYKLLNPSTDVNDVWNYDPSISQWTWVHGDSIAGRPGIYGRKGIADTANKPGARHGAASWSDGAGNVWMFGGSMSINKPNEPAAYLNDLWKYSAAGNVWTWIGGDSATNSKGVYGTKGKSTSFTIPPARLEAVTWVDTAGRFWLFGGLQKESTELYNATGPLFNDLWMYDPVTNQWTWKGGDSAVNQPGQYGRQGVPNPANQPGARGAAMGWTDRAGNLRLYGGSGYGWIGKNFLNDEWMFSPAPPPLPLRFLDFTATAQGGQALLQWHTTGDENGGYYVVQRSRDGQAYDSLATIASSGGSPSSTHTYAFTDPDPIKALNYYRIRQVSADGRSVYSSAVQLSFLQNGFSAVLLPNPVRGDVKMRLQTDRATSVQIRVSDAMGHILFSRQQELVPGSSVYTIPVKGLTAGTYFVIIHFSNTRITKKFIKL